MQTMQHPAKASPPVTGLRFYVTERKPPSPIAMTLAVLTAGAVLFAVAFGLGHRRAAHIRDGGSNAARTPGGASAGSASSSDDDDDDPNQIDTIYLGDAADAPEPARKRDKNGKPGNVHATIAIRLPRYGDQVGLIPDTPPGHLLYKWLAAFNQASETAMEQVLPNDATVATASALMELRIKNGGFRLLSAKEIEPGVLVFRMHDQTPAFNEVLGTLYMQPKSNPPAIASFSLRAVQ